MPTLTAKATLAPRPHASPSTQRRAILKDDFSWYNTKPQEAFRRKIPSHTHSIYPYPPHQSPSSTPYRNSLGRRPLAPRAAGRPCHLAAALEQHLEPVLERDHVGVDILLHLKGVGNDLDGPLALHAVAAGLEAEPEVARMLRDGAEGVHGARGVGIAVRGEPLLCGEVSIGKCIEGGEWGAYLSLPWCPSGSAHLA